MVRQLYPRAGESDPNARDQLTPLNPVKRYKKPEDAYAQNEPGYRCISRVPRVTGLVDPLPDADADRIEQIMGDGEEDSLY